MKFNKLGVTEMEVSHISMGGAAFTNIYGAYEEERCLELLREALKCGINYFETSHWYGQGSSERTFGKGLAGVPRDSYYIASKVGRYELDIDRMFDFSAEKTAATVDNTLARLNLDYVDIIQVHDLSFAPDMSIILNETLPTLEKAVKDGKAKFIGLADYDLELMKEVIEVSDIKISSILSYAKSTLHDNRLQNYTKFFMNNGVGVINAAATGMGLLCNSGPQPWHPASDEVKTICKQASEYCKSKNVELARLATWFTLNQPDIDTHMCGFANIEQLKDNINVLEKGLTEHEQQVLKEVQLKYFDRGTMHWDQVEVTSYRNRMQNM